MLSGGERTRLAVARMLLRPSNTLLLDEPTNHLDLDSKDILLEALEDYGGTLIFVSHDRYFVEKLATKIVEIGHGEAIVFPGTYTEFLWSKEQRARCRCVRRRCVGRQVRGRAKARAAEARRRRSAQPGSARRRRPAQPPITPSARRAGRTAQTRSGGEEAPGADLPISRRASPSANRP